jgi:hypothetical protein
MDLIFSGEKAFSPPSLKAGSPSSCAAIKSYKQPAKLRFTVFTWGAVMGLSCHYLVLQMSNNWGGYSQRQPLFNSLLHWPTPTSPKFDSPNENAA